MAKRSRKENLPVPGVPPEFQGISVTRAKDPTIEAEQRKKGTFQIGNKIVSPEEFENERQKNEILFAGGRGGSSNQDKELARQEASDFFNERPPKEKGSTLEKVEEIQRDVNAQEGTAFGLLPRPARVFWRTLGASFEGDTIPQAFAATADIIAMSKKALPFKDKKLFSTQQVEETFNRAHAGLTDEIQALKAGRGDKFAARTNLRMMRGAVQKLESKQKNLEKNDLLYWLKDGKDIQEDIIFFNQIIDEMEKEIVTISAIPAQNENI